MSLASQVMQLSRQQLHEMYNAMLDGGIAHEFSGDYQMIFRRMKNRRIGRMRRMYELLEHATPEEIRAVARALTEELK